MIELGLKHNKWCCRNNSRSKFIVNKENSFAIESVTALKVIAVFVYITVFLPTCVYFQFFPS